jgi:1,4-alpha-glucan branching enzyme
MSAALKRDEAEVNAIVNAEHSDPFSFLGPHEVAPGRLVVRVFQPGATAVELVPGQGGAKAQEGGSAKGDAEAGDGGAGVEAGSDDEGGGKGGAQALPMTLVHEDGLFALELDGSLPFAYRLRVGRGDEWREIDDPYRFGSDLGEMDRYLLAEGNHFRTWEKMGAHIVENDGVRGVRFAVWAPNARRVSVVGDFNDWDGRVHPMRVHFGCGLWEIFIPGIGEKAHYKYEIRGKDGSVLPLKADPYAFFMQQSPGTASIVYDSSRFAWSDDEWMKDRERFSRREAPLSIYEVHPGSWKRRFDEGGRPLSYLELAGELIPYVKEMGFTHIELLPISEYPFDGSWGYQPLGLFAPTSRFGPPDDFRHFVDKCHKAGLGVILDWVVGHFPEDAHGLARFDGTALYEHEDPRKGRHQDWGTLIYNFSRAEVANYLLANALYWLDSFHIDGLRVDAVASMLYLDYSRKEGEWLPNEHGGNENLEAIAFLRRMNELVYGLYPGAFTIAEESTSWPMVSRPTSMGGLGFGYKWNMGWMNDTLEYISEDPVHRKYHHDKLTFSFLYAFSENFVLPISHDEVVHGKGSLLGRMPGDEWQRFANMRAYLAYMFAHPGKKLLFMGCEFAQGAEWDHNGEIAWGESERPLNAGVQTLVRELNRLYRQYPALHERDCEESGFSWIECCDRDQSVISFVRRAADPDDHLIFACNFTPVPRENYQLGAPRVGRYEEILNTDAETYGGSNVINQGHLNSFAAPRHGQPCSLTLNIPPLGALILRPVGERVA